tara:strand:+ start:1060 stop:1239 length:180 start_codon:yes stop_codon:yes gene_type:complete
MNINTVKKVIPRETGTLDFYKVTENGTIDETYVPIVADNTDYQEILEWEAEGNTIEEAD